MSRTHIPLLPLTLAGVLLSAAVCPAGWLQPGIPGAAGWFVDGRPAPTVGVVQFVQSDVQAWVSVVGGTVTLWRVESSNTVCRSSNSVVVTASSGDGIVPAVGEVWPRSDLATYSRPISLGGGWQLVHWNHGAIGWYLADPLDNESDITPGSVAQTYASADPAWSVTFELGYVTNTVVYTNAYPLVLASDMPPDPGFPVFQLDLGGPWTDFLLKGSTDNFATCCYVVSSSTADVGGDGDANVAVYFTDDYADDPRAWKASLPGVPIVAQLADAVNGTVSSAIVCPSHQCDVDWATWMSADNAHLVWSYLRMNADGYETNTTGQVSAVNGWSGAAHWRPVQPIGWRKQRISP